MYMYFAPHLQQNIYIKGTIPVRASIELSHRNVDKVIIYEIYL